MAKPKASAKKATKSKSKSRATPKTTVKVTTVAETKANKKPSTKSAIKPARKAKKAKSDKKRKLGLPKLPDNKAGRAIKKLRPRSPFRGYFVESWREVRRVKWPKRREAWKLTFAVIVFSVVFAAFLATLDFLFEKLAKVIFLR